MKESERRDARVREDTTIDEDIMREEKIKRVNAKCGNTNHKSFGGEVALPPANREHAAGERPTNERTNERTRGLAGALISYILAMWSSR